MARVPLYKAAETEMTRRIQSGEWEVGRRLPNEFQLADEFGVSQGTMRRALITLEGMGLLARKPGRGTIVSEPSAASAPHDVLPLGFDRLLTEDGTPLALDVFRARSGLRGAEVEEEALLGSGRLSYLERTLRRDGNRFALEDIVVDERAIPAFDEDGPTDFIALLATHGLKVVSVHDALSAAITSMSDAVALSVDRHTPLLVLTRVAIDATGTALARQRLRMVAEDLRYDLTLTG